MPWKKVNPMDEKIRFVHLAKSGRFTMTELCHDFDISRGQPKGSNVEELLPKSVK